MKMSNSTKFALAVRFLDFQPEQPMSVRLARFAAAFELKVPQLETLLLEQADDAARKLAAGQFTK